VYGTVNFGWFNGVSLSTGGIATGYISPNSSSVLLYQYPSGGGSGNNIAYDPIGNIALTLTYMAEY
jgi:hypothetical protein